MLKPVAATVWRCDAVGKRLWDQFDLRYILSSVRRAEGRGGLNTWEDHGLKEGCDAVGLSHWKRHHAECEYSRRVRYFLCTMHAVYGGSFRAGYSRLAGIYLTHFFKPYHLLSTTDVHL